MRKLSQIWFEVQEILFPFIEKKIEEPLTDKLKNLVPTLELIRIEEMRNSHEGRHLAKLSVSSDG